MKCKDVYKFICDNLDRNIRSARCRAIRQHLDCCPDCQAYLDSVKKTVSLYRTAPAPKVPRALHRTLMNRIDVEQGPVRKRRNSRTARA